MRIDNTLVPNDGNPNFGKPFDKFLTRVVAVSQDRTVETGADRTVQTGATRTTQ